MFHTENQQTLILFHRIFIYSSLSFSSIFLCLCRWSSLLWETTSSIGTTLWARMNLSYWRSDRRCRMPSSSSLQGTRHIGTHAFSLSIYNDLCILVYFYCLIFYIICVCDYVPRSKEVDWQPYFTTRLVDDFATHLRVFRKAQDRLADREDKQSKRTHSYLVMSFHQSLVVSLWATEYEMITIVVKKKLIKFLIKSDDESFDISGDDGIEEEWCLNRGHNRGAGGLLLWGGSGDGEEDLSRRGVHFT